MFRIANSNRRGVRDSESHVFKSLAILDSDRAISPIKGGPAKVFPRVFVFPTKCSKSQIASDFKSRSPNRKNIPQIAVKNASNRNSNRVICGLNQGPLNGRVSSGGGLPDLGLSFLFCPFCDFPDFSGIFPICSGMVRGFSRFVLFLFLGLLRAPTRNSPERVRDTIWTFPKKSGKPPGLETPPV